MFNIKASLFLSRLKYKKRERNIDLILKLILYNN